MAIRKSTNYNIQEVFDDFGYDYTDFIKYMEDNSTPSTTRNKEREQCSSSQVINEFIININKDALLEIKSSNTIKYYLSFLLRFMKFINEKYPDLLFIDLNEIIFHKFIGYTNEINNSKLSHGSINTYISILRKVCTFAHENDFIHKNINYKFNKISFNTLPRYMSEEQIEGIFNEATKKNNAILWKTTFITLLGTGLRIQELANLQIRDFNIEKSLIFTIGKGKKERYIPIYPGVEKAVLNYLKQTDVKNIQFSSGYLFSRQHGNQREAPVSVRSIQYNFRIIADKLNLDNRFSVHSFRHKFAVNCLKADMQLAYLCQILGHSSATTTAIYTQLLPSDLQQLVEQKYPIPFEKLIKQLLS